MCSFLRRQRKKGRKKNTVFALAKHYETNIAWIRHFSSVEIGDPRGDNRKIQNWDWITRQFMVERNLWYKQLQHDKVKWKERDRKKEVVGENINRERFKEKMKNKKTKTGSDKELREKDIVKRER